MMLILSSLFAGTGVSLAVSALNAHLLGHPHCKCLGNNDLIPDGSQVKSRGYGIDCRPWDKELDYCERQINLDEDHGYNEGYEWCAYSWCYIDPTNCEGPVKVDGEWWEPTDDDKLHHPSVVWPNTVVSETEGLFYSYQTCGNEDHYNAYDIEWIWDFQACPPRHPNDYYMLVDGSESVSDEWGQMRMAMRSIVENGMHMEHDRIGMLVFSGQRSHEREDVVSVYDFESSREEALQAIDEMENLGGQTWTLMGLQRTVQQWNAETEITDEPNRKRILLLVTDGRPKPRINGQPGCVTSMNDLSKPVCETGNLDLNSGCRNRYCKDVDMSTNDCCPGDQDPCSSDERESLVQSLQDNDILTVVIAVGTAGNIKSEDGEVLYFHCLLTDNYDQSNTRANAIPHRVATISNFDKFFEYQDPTASTQGGVDGALCIDPVVFLPPAPPTSACTEVPEPKQVVIALDSSKSMYTTKNRGGTQAGNWLNVMGELQAVICLHVSDSDTCAYTSYDSVGLVAFATNVAEVHHINDGNWFSGLFFTKETLDGEIVANIVRHKLKYMTDTVAGLHAALDQMKDEPKKTWIRVDGVEEEARREVIIITDGRPHCKKEDNCQPCGATWKDETLQKLADAECDVKMVWRGDRDVHDGSIIVDVDFLKRDDVFGCLPIDFDDNEDFVTIEEFDDADFLDALRGDITCAQMQEGN